MKKISVIIPCYNVEKYIDRCVDSLLKQTIGLESLELIFVNDASTDHTLDKLLAYEKQYKDSIMVIHCEQNGRQGTARNIGMQYASCDYIGFVDSDDWIEYTMYEKLYEKAVSLDVDVVYCRQDQVYSSGKTESSPECGQDRHFVIKTEQDRKEFAIAAEKEYGVSRKIYKKSVIFDNGVFFPEGLVYEDSYWWGILKFYIDSAYLLEEVLYHYRINMSSTTKSQDYVAHLDRLVIEEMKLLEYKERGFYKSFRDIIDEEFIRQYWFNGLYIIFTRFDVFPLEIFKTMQNTVMKYVPNYATLREYTGRHQLLIDMVDLDVSQEELNRLQKAYLADRRPY